MKIAIASTGLGHISRGIESWARDLAYALADRGIDVRLCKGAGPADSPLERVIPCWKRDEPKTQQLLKLLPKWLGWRIGLGSGYAIEQASFSLRLIRFLRQEKIDILHVQDPQLAIIVQRASQAGLVSTRVVLGHGTEEPLSFLQKIDYLQQLAPWHLEQAKNAGVFKPAWTAIPNFIDTDRFTPSGLNLREELGISGDALVVMTAAAIKRDHKRIDYLIQEFAALRQQHPELPAWLVIAGGAEAQTNELMQLGRDLLGDRVRFLVRFPRDRMPDLYRTADVFVLASLSEMMPIALLEATASGLPCIVHQHPVMQYMTGAGGVSCDISLPGTLARETANLLKDENKRHLLSNRARSHCISHFRSEVVLNSIISYYHKVLEENQPATSATHGSLAY